MSEVVKRKRWMPTVAVLALCAAAALPAGAQAATATYTVSGTVTSNASGAPIAGARVTVSTGEDAPADASPSLPANDVTTTTNANGQYSVTVRPGYDSVTASAPGYVTTTPTANVAANATVNVTLAPASFAGTVTDAGSGFVKANQTVALYEVGATAAIDQTTTNENGQYAFPASDWTSGHSYYIAFPLTGNPTAYYDATATGDAGTQATQLSSPQTGLDVTLTAATGEITGTVSDPSGTVAEADVFVFATGKTAGAAKAAVSTSSTGTYVISGLAAGKYEIEATAPTMSDDITTWAPNALAPSPAGALTLSSSADSSAGDVSIVEGGVVSGAITVQSGTGSVPSAAGGGVAGATVDLVACGSSYSAETASDGTYETGDVPPGSYDAFIDTTTSNSTYTTAFESGFAGTAGAALSLESAAAVPVQVAAGQVTALNQALAQAGEITGSVSDGLPDVYGSVELLDVSGAVLDVAGVSNGQYSLTDVPTGTYYLKFLKSGSTSGVYYGGAKTLSASLTVAVTAGTTTPNVDISTRSAALIPAPGEPSNLSLFSVPGPSLPLITGTAKAGATLKADVSTWTCQTGLTYQWYANGKKLAGAVNPTLVVPGSAATKTITVAVTGPAVGYPSTTKSSAMTAAVAVGTLKVAAPKIAGSVKVGAKLTAKPGAWTKGTKFTYQWFAGGKAIKHATKSSLKLVAGEKGKAITVKVTGKLTGYKTVVKTSKATKKVG